MKHFESTALIHAGRDRVWEILTETAAYPQWDSGVVRVDGTLAPGEKLKVTSEVNPKRAYPVTVAELVPAERMVWVGGSWRLVGVWGW